MSRAWARPALVLLALLGLALVPAGAQAGWSAPFDLVAPGSLDYLPTQLAVSASGSAAGYAVQDVDTPGSAQAYLVLRSPGGGVGPPQVIPGAREILALAYSGRGLELLTGSSPAGLDCCSSTQAVAVAGARQSSSSNSSSNMMAVRAARRWFSCIHDLLPKFVFVFIEDSFLSFCVVIVG